MIVSISKPLPNYLLALNPHELEVAVWNSNLVNNFQHITNPWFAITTDFSAISNGDTLRLNWGLPGNIVEFTFTNLSYEEEDPTKIFISTDVHVSERIAAHPLVAEFFDVSYQLANGATDFTTLFVAKDRSANNNLTVISSLTISITDWDSVDDGLLDAATVYCRVSSESFMGANDYKELAVLSANPTYITESNLAVATFRGIDRLLADSMQFNAPTGNTTIFAKDQSKKFNVEIWAEWKNNSGELKQSSIVKNTDPLRAIYAGVEMTDRGINYVKNFGSTDITPLFFDNEKLIVYSNFSNAFVSFYLKENTSITFDWEVYDNEGNQSSSKIFILQNEIYGEGIYHIKVVDSIHFELADSISYATVILFGSYLIKFITDKRFASLKNFLFFNDLGGVEMIYFNGNRQQKLNITKADLDLVVDSQNSLLDAHKDSKTLTTFSGAKLHTGYLNNYFYALFKLFLASKLRYELFDTDLMPPSEYGPEFYFFHLKKVLFQKDSFDLKSEDSYLNDFEVEYRYAEENIVASSFERSEFKPFLDSPFSFHVLNNPSSGSSLIMSMDGINYPYKDGEEISFPYLYTMSATTPTFTRINGSSHLPNTFGLLAISPYGEDQFIIEALPRELSEISISCGYTNIDYFLTHLLSFKSLSYFYVYITGSYLTANAEAKNALMIKLNQLYKLYGTIATIELAGNWANLSGAGLDAKSELVANGVTVTAS